MSAAAEPVVDDSAVAELDDDAAADGTSNRTDRGHPSYEGWKEIAAALGVSEDTAQEYADRPYLPLVVFVDHAGRVWTPRANVTSFVNLHHMPLWAHRALKKAKLLPGQLKTPAALRRRRRRGARRASERPEGE